MYKLIRKIHLWLSVPFGVLISIISITGFILLFQPSREGGGESPEFFLDVMRFHRWLFDAPAVKGDMTVGKMIVAISTIAMVLILLTGIVMWCYRLKGGFLRALKISFSKGFGRFCSTLHTAGGTYVVLFLLLMALTGLTWSFGWYRSWFYDLFGIMKGSHVVFEIHSGAFGGGITKVIWGVSALIGFTLPLTGYYMWIRRLKMTRK